jgi:hypothetical protein
MEFTRILDLRQFDRTSERFRDNVLRHSKKPANVSDTPDGRRRISVFDTACACSCVESGCICRHITRFYSKVVQEPCAYWTFDFDNIQQRFPTPLIARQSRSESGDDCHYTIHNLSDKQADKKIRYLWKEEDFGICINGQSEPFTNERAIALIDRYYPDLR